MILNVQIIIIEQINIIMTAFDTSRLQLKRGLFGYGIIPKCTKWSHIGVHGLKFGRIFAKFQCAFFLIRKNVEKR